MITRSFNPEVMRKAFEPHEQYQDPRLDYDAWVGNPDNVMYTVDNGDVGLATFEYPGVYSVHWFFNQTKGRAAINLAREMLTELFDKQGAEVVRGLTPIDNKAARFLAKYVGMKSHGIVDTVENGPHELMLMTKEEFYGS